VLLSVPVDVVDGQVLRGAAARAGRAVVSEHPGSGASLVLPVPLPLQPLIHIHYYGPGTRLSGLCRLARLYRRKRCRCLAPGHPSRSVSNGTCVIYQAGAGHPGGVSRPRRPVLRTQSTHRLPARARGWHEHEPGALGQPRRSRGGGTGCVTDFARRPVTPGARPSPCPGTAGLSPPAQTPLPAFPVTAAEGADEPSSTMNTHSTCTPQTPLLAVRGMLNLSG
jgi:hypothetical protein